MIYRYHKRDDLACYRIDADSGEVAAQQRLGVADRGLQSATEVTVPSVRVARHANALLAGVVDDAAEPLCALVVSLEQGEVGAKPEISIAVTVHADC